MTDITSKNNVYYTASQYNATSDNVDAQVDVNLVYPLLDTSSDYQVAVSKARIDLSTIPLTRGNIPLKKYQVGLQSGTTLATAYVRQFNSTTGNYVYNITPAGIISKNSYTNTGSTSPVGGLNISTYFGTIKFFLVDDYENYYVAGNVLPNASANLLMIFKPDGTVLYQTTYTQIQCMSIDRRQNLYIADSDIAGESVFVYSNANGEGVVSLTLVATLTTDFNGNPLSEIATVCADDQIIVGSGANTITLYDAVSFQALTTFTQSTITQLSSPSAVMSAYDRYVVCDNGTSTNFLFGIPTASNTATNLISGNEFVVGGWLAGAKMALNSSYGYGVGQSDNYTYQFPYNPVSGTCGAPVNVNTQNMEHIISYPSGNNIMGLGLGGNVLLAYNVDNLTTNTWYRVDTSFVDGSGDNFLSLDYRNSSGQIVAVNSGNGLVMSDRAIHPKVFYFGDPASINQTNTKQFGVGWSSNASLIENIAGDTGYSPVGFYKNGNLGYRCEYNTGNNAIQVVVLNLPSMTVSATYALTDIIWDGTSTLGFSQSKLGYFAVSANGQHVYFYMEDGTYQSTITLPSQTINSLGIYMDVMVYGGVSYMAFTSGLYISIYTLNDMTAPVLINSFLFTPYGSPSYPSQNVFSVKWVQQGSALPYLYCVSNGYSAYTIATALFKVGFTDDTFTEFSISNTVRIGVDGTGYTSLCDCLAKNGNLNELYVMQGGVSVSGNIVEVWNVVSQTKTATLTFDGLNEPTFQKYFYACPEISDTWNWNAITQATSKNLISVAVSKDNSNVLFALDTAGALWRTVITAYSVANWVSVETFGSTAYQSVNVFNTPQANYDGHLYAYGLHSGQTLHGTYHSAGYPILSVARNDVVGEFVLSTNGHLVSLDPDALAVNWTSAFSGANVIWVKNGQDIDAGPYDIFTFSTLITAINNAFLEAFAKLPGGTFTEPPTVSLDYTTGLATIAYSPDYAQGAVDIGILLNKPLSQLLFFDNVVDALNSSFNMITLVKGSTSTTQSDRSLYQFNQLDKIVFISNTIYVSGSYFGNNNTNNIITDIDVPTSTAGYIDNIGQVLYYQPTFLRVFMLASNNALQRVQLSVNYVYLDGTQYALQVAPSQNWNAKLIFPKKF